MWIEKATEKYNTPFFLFENFLDGYGFNQVKILPETKEIDGMKAYCVQANYYVKDEIHNFYFTDFSVMTDLMANQGFALKSRNLNVDTKWELYVSSGLNKEDKKEYVKQFKQYQNQKLEEDKKDIKEFLR